MKAAPGDGMWPGLWMLPGPAGKHGDDYEIDLQEGGFVPPNPASETYAWNLHRGSTTWGGTVKTGVDLSASYHTYHSIWVSGQSTYLVSGWQEIAKLTSAQASIPDEPMELIMDLAVAGSTRRAGTSRTTRPRTSPAVDACIECEGLVGAAFVTPLGSLPLATTSPDRLSDSTCC